MLEIRGIWLCHMSRWNRYVLRPRIWVETPRSGTVPHIRPYNGPAHRDVYLLPPRSFKQLGGDREATTTPRRCPRPSRPSPSHPGVPCSRHSPRTLFPHPLVLRLPPRRGNRAAPVAWPEHGSAPTRRPSSSTCAALSFVLPDVDSLKLPHQFSPSRT